MASRRLGVFTSQEALAAGHSIDDIKAALRSRRWIRLRKGVYTTRERVAAVDQRERHLLDCVAVLLSLDAGPVLSHSSAARLHELVVPGADAQEVRVTDVDQWRRGRGYRVARAGLAPGDVVPWLKFGAMSVARTLVDCAREWPLLAAVVAMDAALLAAGLPVPEVQVELHDSRGFLARVDAWYEEAAVAIEFDGRVKYLDPRDGRSAGEVLWQEKRREDQVRGLDVRFVRLVKEDLGARWAGVSAGIARLLATPYAGHRRFTVVRRREPGSDVAA